MDKRKFLKTASVIGAGVVLQPLSACKNLTTGSTAGVGSTAATNQLPVTGVFTLPELGYAYNALEPAIDALTMEIHHSKHHAAYVNNLNKAVESSGAKFAGKTLEEILKTITPEDTAVRNNGGGHWNHSAFWQWISPGGSKTPSPQLMAAITASFGSFETFQQKFDDAAKTRFGSGWAWLCVGSDKKLIISSTPNQDNPMMYKLVDTPGKPILGIDVWEHAYYLNYQNRRPDYITAFRGLINWDVVQKFYDAALLD